MDLRDYLRVLRRQWVLVVVGLLLGTAVGVVIILRATPLYSSTVRLFVSTPGSDTANAQMYQGGLFSQQRVTSYADLIKGSTVAEKVLSRVGSDETPAALVNQITATADPDSVILQITVTDPSPARAQLLAQTTAEVFTDYVGELESAEDPARSPIRAAIVDSANLPVGPVYPRPLITIGLGAIIGLLLGLAAAWLRETLDTSLKTVDEVQKITGASMLGSVFFDPGATKKPLISGLSPHAPRVESFRVLRTNLQFLDVDGESKSYAITSPLPGDGKSTTSINIAIASAEAGRRTLLLEGDLRRPKFADYLDLEGEVGLTTVLIGEAELADAIQPWGRSGLDVITSGSLPPNPAELLQSKAMAAVMAELRRRYDVIIVDAPPILPVTDAALIAAQTSGAILVLRHGRTTRDQAAGARQRLDSVGAQVLGTVFNFVPQRAISSYGYGYGYGYAPAGPVDTGTGHGDPDAEADRTARETISPAGDPGPAAEPVREHRNGDASGALHRATS
ncbi:MAG TPA: polysaccharide biosynthesis tyrosine autokinase [Micropruina sp.]|nr:polysaccharide biosynthesis tyrosine autokinase [Micropruina sp.]